jgi:hypothetical protein
MTCSFRRKNARADYGARPRPGKLGLPAIAIFGCGRGRSECRAHVPQSRLGIMPRDAARRCLPDA